MKWHIAVSVPDINIICLANLTLNPDSSAFLTIKVLYSCEMVTSKPSEDGRGTLCKFVTDLSRSVMEAILSIL